MDWSVVRMVESIGFMDSLYVRIRDIQAQG